MTFPLRRVAGIPPGEPGRGRVAFLERHYLTHVRYRRAKTLEHASMRDLTEHERAERDRRRAGMEPFLAERMPALTDFAQRLELRDPPMIVADPDRFFPSIDAYMKDRVVQPEDRVWILTRLGYLIGEVLIQHLSGSWLLNEIPDSRYYLRYVVGQFAGAANPAAMVDPFHVADAYLAQPPGRSLSGIVKQVEDELRRS